MNYPQSATSGDVINVNGIDIKIRNTLTLNSDTNGEFYSIIAPPSNTVFYVDKDKIFDILFDLYEKDIENTNNKLLKVKKIVEGLYIDVDAEDKDIYYINY